jgi:hypothetical protein
MIADLKADSLRWDNERRQAAGRGQPSNGISSRESDGTVRNSNTPIVEYRSSNTHQSRQHYGPTEGPPLASAGGYGPTAAYPPAGPGAPAGAYESAYQSPQYGQPAPVYATSTQYPAQDTYFAGGEMAVDQQRSGRGAPLPQSGAIPRTGPQYASPPYQQVDSRSYHNYPTQNAPSPVSYGQGYTQQLPEPYGRGAYKQTSFPSNSDLVDANSNRLAAPPAGAYSVPAPEGYDNRAYHQDTGAYSQAQIPSTTATSGSSRHNRERESERDGRHHRNNRR